MANKKFQLDAVLASATEVFWQYGYHGTSIQQLVNATGLKPGSLYREFDSKDGLYKRTLSRYALNTVAEVNAHIADHKDVCEGIRHILAQTIEVSKETNYCGCFLIKSQLELSSHNREIYHSVLAELKTIEANYASQLKSMFSVEDSALYAKQIMMVIFGIRVYGYQKENLAALKSTTRSLLPWLYGNM
ncbi:TetR/AcrR family transcriptional regulator [Agaribacter flavus]|uniref:TetR/AcrR family transcriptional regulator n=1 Tax=Agaribacter flavus TaxID=1902781 RepID=A0ABV7FQ18_9ALTE